MAAHYLDIPQMTVGIQDDNNPSSLDNSSFKFPTSGPPMRGDRSSPSDTVAHRLLTQVLIRPDVSDSPASRNSDAHSSLPTSPTQSAHSSARAISAGSRDNNSCGLSSSSFLAPPTPGHMLPVSSIGTNRDVNGSSSLRLSPLRSCHRDAPVVLLFPGSDTSRSSSGASFFKRIICFRNGDHSDLSADSAEVEAHSNVEPFAFKPLQLVALIDSKSLENLESLGGVDGLLGGLGTNRLCGLNTTKLSLSQSGSPDLETETNNAVTPFGMELTPMTTSPAVPSTASLGGVDRSASLELSAPATIEDRQRVYGHNIFPHRPSKRLLLLTWLAPHGKVLFYTSTAAVASLALGVSLDFSSIRTEGDLSVDWVESIAIIVAILIIVIVGSLIIWDKEKQFRTLNEKNEDSLVKVIRDGGEQQIRAHEVVVGDVVLIEPKNVIPCDGVFLSGHNVSCDESDATRESDENKKLSYQECIALRDERLLGLDTDGSSGNGESPSGLEFLGHADCFIVSGSKVIDGFGSYVVTSVGTKSFNGRIMMALSNDPENTPLQLKLNDLAEAISKIGSVAGGLLFVALLVRYFFELGTNDLQSAPGEMGVAFINILNMAVTLVIIALPKGLPLAITLALAFATKQMSKENLLVRVIGSCETMANATVICTDKSGMLTQNEMTVVAGTVGVHAKFMRRLEERREQTGSEARSNSNAKNFDIDLANLDTALPHPVKDLLIAAITIKSMAFEDVDPKSGAPVFIGDKTESALLEFAKELGWPNYKITRVSADIVKTIPFSSDCKYMGCVVRLPDGSYRLYVKGASEKLAPNCARHVILGDTARSANEEVETAPIGELEEDHIARTITFYASQALRTIALCYRDFPCWPPNGAQLLDKGEVDHDDLMTDLTLISIIGIEDPLRPGVREAVDNCGKAGVRVKMCTGDNVLTAKPIAQQCGIYTPGGIVMEGPNFRTLSPDLMKVIVPQLQVLARSSPEDKRMLVETLKELGDVVGVTGGSTNDGPVLKIAHVGFSTGIAGTEVAKEASDIILMDDAFPSIVSAIIWGRCINDSVRKFIQFMISGNVTAVVTTFVWVLASSSEDLWSAVQLLWVNLIMDTFAALALATDPASPVQLERKPDKKTDPLFTVNMIKQILGQAVYQIAMVLIFHFVGLQILGFHHTDDSTLQEHNDGVVRTLIFNAFVFAQISNSFNCRRLDRKLNVFEGTTKNWCFMAVITIEVAVQVLICFCGGSVFDVTRMGAREWAISLALGCVPLPLGALIRLIPNEPCERGFKKSQLLPMPEVLPTTRPDSESGSSSAMDYAAELRRGCMHGSSLVRKHCKIPDPNSSRLPLARALHCQSPCASGSLSDPDGFDPSRSSATLLENGFEVHPETPRDDPVYGLLGLTP
ncbi:calcium-translocating P-type ATPase [Lactarius tabidus]